MPVAIDEVVAACNDYAMDEPLHRLRHASRIIARSLDLLEDRHGPTGLTRTQVDAFLELEAGATTVGRVGEALGLDKSTASRAIEELARRGWAEGEEDAGDRRRRLFSLTPRGKAKLTSLHNALAGRLQGVLDTLSPDEAAAVVRGAELFARGLERERRGQQLRVRPIEARDDAVVAAIIRRVMPEFGADGAGFAIHDAEVAHMAAAYQAPGHAYFVVEQRGEVKGGAGVAPLHGVDGVCELRKMYFLPELRGVGAGARMMRRCLATARELGYRQVYLETLAGMTQARRLYEGFGFRALPAAMGDTGHHGCNSWYLLDLG